MRVIHKRYRDPLDEIWIVTAKRVGFDVERSIECFASVQGTRLIIGAPSTLDVDDCLAQMIFHELCHSMVQGEAGLTQQDWGLQNVAPDETDEAREHAALRLQAALADRHGLREVLAPTTSFRTFYDRLPSDPLTSTSLAEVAEVNDADAFPAPEDASIALARAALEREHAAPWHPHVGAALLATRTIVDVVRPFAGTDTLLGD